MPTAYRVNKLCFGGSITRSDLLLSCEDKRFVITQAELEQCFRVENAVLCPKDVLSVVEDPTWLGLKWVPQTELSFQHSHVPMSTCPSLRPLRYGSRSRTNVFG